ncbi:drap deaminase [Grosmannia clavigera kw1407]|uniref:Drap deaminase n=1 Tax=Grosmannia clavigera (strain kw1407 / UAMH 11150) TaxID=655863 RepID=F0XGH2_GROCL|nr:drap deaminase [Grosmannia clavigera kw1407]EFX02957.1 drap deaminase [Grosmannia clavigera kw1407]
MATAAMTETTSVVEKTVEAKAKAMKKDLGDDAATAAHAPSQPGRFYIEDGLRRVEPYYYTYNTWVKERWRGREVLAVFESEFRDRPLAYYRAALEAGTVTVNQQTVGPDHVLRNGERISHRTHRHEPPVTAEPIVVIHEDDDMVVINKPAGVPVHPAGRYQYNSVVEMLKAQREPGFMPYPCNRLDRLTSGIMFLAKSPAAAKRLSLQIQARAVRKEYLARVVGRFPDGQQVCDQPILQISPKLGLNRVRANGRSARTVFQRLAYYEGSAGGRSEGYSVVRCLPVTGRTHQIRVHLQYLGHPIENDPIYANQRVWGFELGAGDADASRNTDEDVISRLSRMGKEDVADAVAYYDEMVDEYHKRRAEKMSGQVCAECATPLYTDPGAHELSLWLHSLRYQAADGAWSYVSPLPAWALPPAGTSGPTEVGALDDLVGASEARGAIQGEDAGPPPAVLEALVAKSKPPKSKTIKKRAAKAAAAAAAAAAAEDEPSGETEAEATETETKHSHSDPTPPETAEPTATDSTLTS